MINEIALFECDGINLHKIIRHFIGSACKASVKCNFFDLSINRTVSHAFHRTKSANDGILRFITMTSHWIYSSASKCNHFVINSYVNTLYYPYHKYLLSVQLKTMFSFFHERK